MNSEHTTPILQWHCGCHQSSAPIPIAQTRCPHCNATIPRKIRKQIYQQVLREIRDEVLADCGARWAKYARINNATRPFLRVLMFLLTAAWVALLVLLLPQFFPSALSALTGPLHTLQQQLPEKIPENFLQPITENLQRIPLSYLLDKLKTLLFAVFEVLALLYTRIVWVVETIISFFQQLLK